MRTATLTAGTSALLPIWYAALRCEAFVAYQVTLKHLVQALPQARERAFGRLVQALFREGLLKPQHLKVVTDGIELPLPASGGRLHFQHLLGSRLDAWQLSGELQWRRDDGERRTLHRPAELLHLLGPQLAAVADQARLRSLAAALDNSLHLDSLCLAFHRAWNRRLAEANGQQDARNLLARLRTMPAAQATLLLEQWGAQGHPWHPCSKAKIGLSTPDVVQHAPEFAASFAIPILALRRDAAHCESLHQEDSFADWWRAHFPDVHARWHAQLQQLGQAPHAYLPLPVHPCQQGTLKQMFAAESERGLLLQLPDPMLPVRPSMSFRTLWTGDTPQAPLLKLPVSLRLTSALRTVSPRSARMGPRLSRLLHIVRQREPQLAPFWDFLPERHGVHLRTEPPDDSRARHLSMLCRDNPASRLQHGELAIPVGSLFVADHTGEPLLRQWVALARGARHSDAAVQFFHDYAALTITPLLALYLIYGIAFEAHQQNSFVVMNAAGQPARLLLQDFGDLRIHRPTLQAQGLGLDNYDPAMTVFDEVQHVRDKLLHAFFLCHLGELARYCEQLWPASPAGQLWQILAARIADTFAAVRHRVCAARWRAERLAFLHEPWPSKALLHMQLQQTQTDLVGRMPNPLAGYRHG